MSRQIVVKRIAENEFYEAVTWYEEQQTGLGIRFAENVWKCFGRILENPRLFAPTEHGTRRAVVRRFPFIIEFRERGEEIRIVAVFNTNRDPNRLEHRR